jgi:xanthine dehydrogenase YagS FAD-binding subunit
VNRFEHVSATSIDEVFLYMQNGWQTRLIAGGTDLLHEMKQGIEKPLRLIDIKGVAGLGEIVARDGTVGIGALTTLDEIEKNQLIAERFPVLQQAASQAASPQLRNMATIAGNICQRPRCWYYRNPEFPCLRKGGTTCFAAGGENAYHAILDGGPCHIVCPSDMAPALMALGASMVIARPGGETRTISLDEFFVGPKTDPHRENVLAADEMIIEFVVPEPSGRSNQIYIKIRERKSWDFALASVAAMVEVSSGVVEKAGVVFGGVAPNPWRSTEAESMLVGAKVSAIDASSVAKAVTTSARPLRDNRYKVELVQNIAKRAFETVISAEDR